tara:strand:- start:4090 stop:4413 length:324 start_codon:yes stop_codon:yes gene_type:complete
MARKISRKKKNYFIKFWDGELSLPQSYWVVGVLISIPVGALIGVFTAMINAPMNTMYAFFIPWYVYIIVGIWRSAGRYKGPKFWAILAKILMILSAIRLVVGLLTGV